MNARQRWERVSELLNDALERPPEERRRLLEEECGKDTDLLREVEELVADQESDDDFLARPFFSLFDPPADEESDVGRTIGRFRLVRRLARGGMGTIFLADRIDGEVEQRVAVKLLRLGGDGGEFLQRFRAERQMLADLVHPNVARLLDAGTSADGLPFLVMEYVDGQSIDRYCDELRLTVRQRLQLFRDVCAAVGFVHRNAVIHRDLKPANIMVTAEGEVKLLDFGVAKLKRHDPRFVETGTSASVPMTPRYASPEQVAGGPVDTTSDVYSLGTVLYELLSGRRAHLFTTIDPRHVAEVIRDRLPLRPSVAVGLCLDDDGGAASETSVEQMAQLRDTDARGLSRELAGDLDNIVMKALRKEPRRRFSSVESLSEDLGRYLEGLPVRAGPDTFGYRADKFVRRHRWRLATAAVIVSMLLGFVAVTMVSQARKARIEGLGAEIAREQEISGAITSFLVNFLKSADPSRTDGRELSVQEAFDAAADRLGIDLAEAPEIRATLANAVGGVYRDLRRFGEARPFLESALALRRSTLGDDHPLVAESLHNLANLFLDTGDKEGAGKLMREAIAIQRRAFPAGHRDLARGLTNFAILLRRLGKFEEAEATARQSLVMKDRLFGPGSSEVAYTLNALALIRWNQGGLKEAEEFYRRTVEIRRRSAPQSRELATALSNLGGLLVDLNRPEEALPFHEEALELRLRLFPDGHKHLVVSYQFVGLSQILLGSLDEASESLDRATALSSGLPDQPLRARLKMSYAMLLRQVGDLSGCEATADEAVSNLKESHRADIAEARSIKAGCLAESGRLEEAEPLLLASYQTLLATRGERVRPTRQARRRLADAYEALGRPLAAARLQGPPSP